MPVNIVKVKNTMVLALPIQHDALIVQQDIHPIPAVLNVNHVKLVLLVMLLVKIVKIVVLVNSVQVKPIQLDALIVQ
jgi:hypothetical protein